MTAALRQLARLARQFSRDQRGATAIEYSILISMIMVALLGISSLTNVANNISDTFNYASGQMK